MLGVAGGVLLGGLQRWIEDVPLLITRGWSTRLYSLLIDATGGGLLRRPQGLIGGCASVGHGKMVHSTSSIFLPIDIVWSSVRCIVGVSRARESIRSLNEIFLIDGYAFCKRFHLIS